MLRIEDTDQARSTPESEQAIFEALSWVGLAWDEGPDVGGPHGPYRQSERLDVYRAHALELVDKGAAYPCFCSSERLSELRAAQTAAKTEVGYDGLCAGISGDTARRRMDAGESYVIRMRVPTEGDCVVMDRLRGEIRIPWAQVDQQVLLKSDGFPTYHLAVVVDDHLMEITHVIRGEEWISSTPKHVLLYRHFGWDLPEFVHLPLLRNPDKSKLSKRKNPTSILYYRDAGFLPEALLNFLGLMAYSMPDGSEAFTLQQFVESFEVDRVSLGGPVFDFARLRSFNARYLREMSAGELVQRLQDWMLNDDAWRRIVPLAQPRLEQLTDLVPMAAYLFADRVEYQAETLIPKGVEGDRVAELLKIAQWELEKPGPWEEEGLKAVFERICENEVLKLKELMLPFFVVLSGSPVSLPAFSSMAILGRDMVIRRLQYAQEILTAAGAGLSNKRLKKLDSHYQRAYGSGS